MRSSRDVLGYPVHGPGAVLRKPLCASTKQCIEYALRKQHAGLGSFGPSWCLKRRSCYMFALCLSPVPRAGCCVQLHAVFHVVVTPCAASGGYPECSTTPGGSLPASQAVLLGVVYRVTGCACMRYSAACRACVMVGHGQQVQSGRSCLHPLVLCVLVCVFVGVRAWVSSCYRDQSGNKAGMCCECCPARSWLHIASFDAKG